MLGRKRKKKYTSTELVVAVLEKAGVDLGRANKSVTPGELARSNKLEKINASTRRKA